MSLLILSLLMLLILLLVLVAFIVFGFFVVTYVVVVYVVVNVVGVCAVAVAVAVAVAWHAAAHKSAEMKKQLPNVYTQEKLCTFNSPAYSSEAPVPPAPRLARMKATCCALARATPSSHRHLLPVAATRLGVVAWHLAHCTSRPRKSFSKLGPKRPQLSTAAGVTTTPPLPGP